MKSALFPVTVAAIVLIVASNGPAGAQSASESMHEAGESTENALSHAYHGTKTAAVDTALTAKVKTALHDDKTTTGADIHVTTVASVVTLRGHVASSEVSNHAQENRGAHQWRQIGDEQAQGGVIDALASIRSSKVSVYDRRPYHITRA